MRRNITNFERTLRVVSGLAILAIALGFSVRWLALVALIPFATGLTGFSPLYQWIGFNDHSEGAPR